jgi:2-keto-4-pentenoate hydratase/2-oxohepta-3-ene-1,7-dioic acid hydratase in catechol pathway
MKLASFVNEGRSTFGVVEGDRVFDLGATLQARYADLKQVLADPQGLEALRAAPRDVGRSIAVAATQWLPVIPNPGAIWCLGLNYRDHVEEMKNSEPNKPLNLEKPVIFGRVADSQTGHRQPLVLPGESAMFDYEGEIAVIIGRGGRRIPTDAAWDHVAGYACYNDGSIRDWQRHSPQWQPGKNFWRTGGFGPWMVTADEIEPDAELTLVTRVNGRELQRATTRMLIHSIPAQIAYLSTFTPLRPGDVIVTGTPGGVGAARTPPLWMKAGDTVEVEVGHVGTLINRVVAEADMPS